MSPHFLTGQDPWPAITRALKRPRRQHAYLAIGFVGRTAAPLLQLNDGDVLICDASERAVKAGATDPPVLKAFLKKGVRVHTHAGLHAKCTVVGRTAWIGSANASRTSSTRLVEAAIQLTDSQTVAEVREWILELAAISPEVDSGELDGLTKFQPKYEPQGPAPYDELEVPATTSRLYLAEFEGGVSKEARAVAEQAQGVIRDAARAESHRVSALDWFEWVGEPDYRRGDWIIDVSSGQRLSRPTCVHAVTPFGKDRCVVWTLKSAGGSIPRRADLILTALDKPNVSDNCQQVKRRRVRQTLALYRK